MPNATALADRLDALAENLRPSTVDVDRAMLDGLRGRRRRAAVAFSLCATVAVACSAALLAGVGSGTGPGPKRTTVVASPEVTFPADDPFQVGAEFGWLPSGMEAQDSYMLGWVTYGDAAWQVAWTTGNDNTGVYLRTMPANWTAQQAAAMFAPKPTAVSQAPVNGRPAYWLVDANAPAKSANIRMIWRLPDGRWGALEYYGTPTAETMRHIAETVTEGSTPQAMPLRITGLPKGASIDAGGFWQSPSEPGDWQATLGIDYGTMYFTVTVTPPGFAGLPGSHPANSVCETRHGLKACVAPNGAFTVPGQLSDDGLKGLLAYVTLMGPDRKSWTTHVTDG